MNKAKIKRRRMEIISALCELSKNGWRNAYPCDYEPLERELRQLDEQLEGATPSLFPRTNRREPK